MRLGCTIEVIYMGDTIITDIFLAAGVTASLQREVGIRPIQHGPELQHAMLGSSLQSPVFST